MEERFSRLLEGAKTESSKPHWEMDITATKNDPCSRRFSLFMLVIWINSMEVYGNIIISNIKHEILVLFQYY